MTSGALSERYMTVQEVAEVARCEHKAVRGAIRSGLLRAFRPAGRLLIRPDDARAWIEGHEAASTPPPVSVAVGGIARGARSRVASVEALRALERKVSHG
jgi:excisionase family DNA binding protein